jgi:hypothetical protein
MRVFHIVLLHDNLLAAVKNVRIHLLDDQAKGVLVSLENFVKQLELVLVFLFKHVDAAGVFRADHFSHLCDEFHFHDLEHLRFRLGLEPVLGVGLLVLEHLSDFVEVLGAVPVRIPEHGGLLCFFLSRCKEVALEMIIVDY